MVKKFIKTGNPSSVSYCRRVPRLVGRLVSHGKKLGRKYGGKTFSESKISRDSFGCLSL